LAFSFTVTRGFNERLTPVVCFGIFFLFSMTELLQLNANKLIGSIPHSFGHLADVHTITLNNNELTGMIPSMLGYLDDIVFLRLNKNKLIGRIPSEIGTCFRLKELRIDHNQISGPIPKELSELKDLEIFTLYENSFIDAEMPLGVCTLVTTGRLTMLSADCPNGVTCDCCHECGK
jgi:Leucine-rich repeat (LRR) protein